MLPMSKQKASLTNEIAKTYLLKITKKTSEVTSKKYPKNLNNFLKKYSRMWKKDQRLTGRQTQEFN